MLKKLKNRHILRYRFNSFVHFKCGYRVFFKDFFTGYVSDV